jgi:hypothetical protein
MEDLAKVAAELEIATHDLLRRADELVLRSDELSKRLHQLDNLVGGRRKTDKPLTTGKDVLIQVRDLLDGSSPAS